MARFEITHRLPPNVGTYPTENREIARKFAKKVYAEFGNFIKAIILFGEAARRTGKEHDIDILIVVDDVSIVLSPELVQTYRIIVEKAIGETSPKLHVMSLKLTTFWEYVRAGDPVIINILRDGVALIDSGFFDPLQLLLRQGRIRPSKESVWNYLVRAPYTISNSKWHILQATLDLYWAVIDSAHAALMHLGEIPPSPAHVAEMIYEKLVKKGIVSKRYAEIMANFYKLQKQITHRELKEISGNDYARYLKDAEDFIATMRGIVEKIRPSYR
ncbi:MAG: nucleotidyltransferase domain-containing protein [Candidatus Woesearchaeota archaeon]